MGNFNIKNTPIREGLVGGDKRKRWSGLEQFKQVSAGAGSNVFKTDPQYGVYVGGSKFSTAPFRLNYDGLLRMGLASGPSLGIDGNTGVLTLYYSDVSRGTIEGYTTEGSEVTYIRILAASGRAIKLKNSFIECNGHFIPTTNEASTLGSSSIRWSEVWGKKIIAWGTGCTFSIAGNDGQSNEDDFITSLRNNSGALEYKYRHLKFAGGICTEFGSESDWNFLGGLS